jgi:hypothetical protein
MLSKISLWLALIAIFVFRIVGCYRYRCSSYMSSDDLIRDQGLDAGGHRALRE